MPRRERKKRKVTLHDVTVDAIVVLVDDQPVFTDYRQTDEKKMSVRLTRHIHRNSSRKL